MKIYFKTREKARSFAKVKPTRKASTTKTEKGWAVSLGAVL